MICGSNGGRQRLNSFALVTYIPGPLAIFLDEMRRSLVPSCVPHAHVTILPPRPLTVDPLLAADQARALLREFAPFEIEAGQVAKFPTTDVIYIEVVKGTEQLRELHAALNGGALGFQEPFEYHPHITLAQELAPENVQPVFEQARRAWAASPHPRRFLVETATFVQNALPNIWIDLEEFCLGAVPSVR